MFQAGQITEIASMGQLVKIDHGLIVERQPVSYKIGTDKAGVAS